MHTLTVIAGGLVLLALFFVAGWLGLGGREGAGQTALWFIPVWCVGALVNMWMGVTRAGYSVAAEAPIFLVVFGVPAAIAWGLRRWTLG